MWPVDQNLFRPKDEAGVPRRFRSHGEAFGWVASSLARMYGPWLLGGYVSAVAVWLVWSVGRSVLFGAPLELVPPDWTFLVAVVVAFPLAMWLLGPGLIYAYLALAGGVMRRDEREQTRR